MRPETRLVFLYDTNMIAGVRWKSGDGPGCGWRSRKTGFLSRRAHSYRIKRMHSVCRAVAVSTCTVASLEAGLSLDCSAVRDCRCSVKLREALETTLQSTLDLQLRDPLRPREAPGLDQVRGEWHTANDDIIASPDQETCRH